MSILISLERLVFTVDISYYIIYYLSYCIVPLCVCPTLPPLPPTPSPPIPVCMYIYYIYYYIIIYILCCCLCVVCLSVVLYTFVCLSIAGQRLPLPLATCSCRCRRPCPSTLRSFRIYYLVSFVVLLCEFFCNCLYCVN